MADNKLDKYFVSSSSVTIDCTNIDSSRAYFDLIGADTGSTDATTLISKNNITTGLKPAHQLLYTYKDNTNAVNYFSQATEVTKETHEGKITFNGYYYQESALNGGSFAPMTAILAGTSPHFNLFHTEPASPSLCTIKRTATSLKIGTTTYEADDFIDGVIPLRLLVVLQAGGGGGGGNNQSFLASQNGAGGGGGACGFYIIDLSSDWKLTVGGGGGGGSGESTINSTGEDGDDGDLTMLQSADNTTFAAVYGGEGGGRGSSSASAPGGAGGTSAYELGSNNLLKVLATFDGAQGGRGTNGTSATNGSSTTGPQTVSATTRINDTSGTLTLDGYAGGSRGGGNNNGGGGGGASWFAVGGNGGWDSTVATAGTLGSGGGGAVWYIGKKKDGADGGDGFARFYY